MGFQREEKSSVFFRVFWQGIVHVVVCGLSPLECGTSLHFDS